MEMTDFLNYLKPETVAYCYLDVKSLEGEEDDIPEILDAITAFVQGEGWFGSGEQRRFYEVVGTSA